MTWNLLINYTRSKYGNSTNSVLIINSPIFEEITLNLDMFYNQLASYLAVKYFDWLMLDLIFQEVSHFLSSCSHKKCFYLKLYDVKKSRLNCLWNGNSDLWQFGMQNPLQMMLCKRMPFYCTKVFILAEEIKVTLTAYNFLVIENIMSPNIIW